MKNYLEKFNKITSVFTKTIQGLNTLSNEITVEYEDNKTSIDRLEERNKVLQSDKETIDRFVNNLSTLVNGDKV